MALDAHFSRQFGLNLHRSDADISIFLKKEGNNIVSSHISLEFTFYIYRKANIFIKPIKLHGKLHHKNHFWYVCTKNNLGAAKRFFFLSYSDFYGARYTFFCHLPSK